MSARPVFHKELGDFFVELREQRGWKQRQAAAIAIRRGLTVLTRQVLLRLENGRTKNPEPEVLKALADLYEMPYEDMVGRFVARRFGLELIARTVSATEALIQGSGSTGAEHALKKGSPGSGKTLAPHQENATESASSTPAQVGEGRAQGGSHDAHGTEGQSAPTPRREPIATNAEIAAQLTKYAGWLAQSAEIQAALAAAAMALVRPEGGANRDTGTGPDPRSGSGGRRNPRGGRR